MSLEVSGGSGLSPLPRGSLPQLLSLHTLFVESTLVNKEAHLLLPPAHLTAGSVATVPVETQSSHACPAVMRVPSLFMSEEVEGEARLLPPSSTRLCLPSPAAWGQGKPAKTKVHGGNYNTLLQISDPHLHRKAAGTWKNSTTPSAKKICFAVEHLKQEKQNMHSMQVPMEHVSKRPYAGP